MTSTVLMREYAVQVTGSFGRTEFCAGFFVRDQAIVAVAPILRRTLKPFTTRPREAVIELRRRGFTYEIIEVDYPACYS